MKLFSLLLSLVLGATLRAAPNAPTSCASNQIVLNGKCVSCAPNQIVKNNACQSCLSNQIVKNGNCVSASNVNTFAAPTCAFNQIVKNGKCESCPSNQVNIKGECGCSSNQILRNGRCESCLVNQIARNGECESLKIWYVSANPPAYREGAGLNMSYPISINDAIRLYSDGDTISLKKGDVFRDIGYFDKSNARINSWGDGPNRPVITSALKVTTEPSNTPVGFIPGFNGNYPGLSIKWIDLSDEFPQIKPIRVIWINGVRFVKARYPNLVNPIIKTINDTDEFLNFAIDLSQLSGCNANNFETDDLNATWTNKAYPGADSGIYTKPANYFKGSSILIRPNNWQYRQNVITGIENVNLTASDGSSVTKAFRLQKNECYKKTNGYIIENNPYELDKPGEFYHDTRNNILYYIDCPSSLCPPSPEWYDQGIWILPEPPYLSWPSMKLGGNNMIVTDLTISKSFFGIIALSGATGSTIKNMKFEDILDSGISTREGWSGTISSSSFTDIEQRGVWANSQCDPTLPMTDGLVTIKDNTFTRITMVGGYTFQGSAIYCCHCIAQDNVIDKVGIIAIVARYHAIVNRNTIGDWSYIFADGKITFQL